MLTDTACKNAHKGEKAALGKAFKLSDDKGLYLHIKPGNKGWSKYWRLKYRIGGTEKLLALGKYPDVTLDQARKRREEARKQLADGIDPGEHKKAVKASKADSDGNSFEVIAREWHEVKSEDKSPRPMRLLNYVIPWLGNKPITDIKARALRNAYRGGNRALMRQLMALLREQKDYIETI